VKTAHELTANVKRFDGHVCTRSFFSIERVQHPRGRVGVGVAEGIERLIASDLELEPVGPKNSSAVRDRVELVDMELLWMVGP
jgi:hypothetical protein